MWFKIRCRGNADSRGRVDICRDDAMDDQLADAAAGEMSETQCVVWYPPAIKHGNGKYTIYRWFSCWNPNFHWIEPDQNDGLVYFLAILSPHFGWFLCKNLYIYLVLTHPLIMGFMRVILFQTYLQSTNHHDIGECDHHHHHHHHPPPPPPPTPPNMAGAVPRPKDTTAPWCGSPSRFRRNFFRRRFDRF